jgi:FkbM family methyltransferase
MRSIRIRHINKFFLHRFGFHLNKLGDSPTLPGLLSKLSKMPFQINSVFDVGAYHGAWSKEVRKVFPKADFYLFEPNSSHNAEISNKGFKVFNLVLGQITGEKVLFYSGGNTGDSYFLEKNPVYLDKAIEVSLTSLDDAIEANSLPVPDLLKLDTQGSEFQILKGAQKYLQGVKVVLIELPITQMNIGAAKLSEIVEFMESQNFVPIHLSEIHIVIDILVQVDIAFLRRDIFIETYGHDDITHRNISPIL